MSTLGIQMVWRRSGENWQVFIVEIVFWQSTTNAKDSEVLKKYMEFGFFIWKTEKCPIKKAQIEMFCLWSNVEIR